jgi:hypothetical protein
MRSISSHREREMNVMARGVGASAGILSEDRVPGTLGEADGEMVRRTTEQFRNGAGRPDANEPGADQTLTRAHKVDPPRPPPPLPHSWTTRH